MESVTAATPPGPVSGGRPIAGWGHRVASFAVDVAFAAAAGWVALRLGAGAGLWVAVTLAAWLLGTTGMVAVANGRSLGKLLVGTRVVSAHGRPAGVSTSLLRDQVARLLYLVPFFFLVDSLFATRESGQTLRDQMVSTHVLREADGQRRAWIAGLVASAVVAAWVFAAAGHGGLAEGMRDYGSFERTAFIEGCSGEGATRRSCGCLFDYIADRVPHDEFERANRTSNPDRWPRRMQRVLAGGVRECGVGDEPSRRPKAPSEESAQVLQLAV